MPSFTTVVEDCSPLIVYSPQWRRGTSRDDKLDSYSQSSFMASTKASDSLTFQYQGTSVTVVGAKRDNHGRYHVTVDSAPSYSASGISQDNSFNQTLFTAQLEYGVHNLVLTNDEDKYLDIDYIAFDTTIGDPEEPLIINSYQDIHPAFTYSPSSSWNQADQASWFSGSSGHQSSDSSAVAQLVFNGVAVALYGSVGPRSSDHFGVKVDDQPLRTLSAKKDQFRAQQLLFWAGDLTPGNHTLFIQQLTNRGAVAIDYANAYTTQSLGGSYDNFVKQLTSGNSTFSSTHTPTSIIAALALTSTVASICSLCLAALLWKYPQRFFLRKKLASIQPAAEMHPFLMTDRRSAMNQTLPDPSASRFNQLDRSRVNPRGFVPGHGSNVWEERATPGSSTTSASPHGPGRPSRFARFGGRNNKGVVPPPEYTPLALS